MLELIAHEGLRFSFPEIHSDARCTIKFQRTLRIPDDNRSYPLPPGFREFPLEHVEDHAASLPKEWIQHGGVLLPIRQAEALWLNFSAGLYNSCPLAIKIATGKINAISGGAWTEALSDDPQDYLVIPTQPWLDGFCVGEGYIRQFVAMPLGEGYTAEEQLTGGAECGGLQIIAYPMKRQCYQDLQRHREKEERRRQAEEDNCDIAYSRRGGMGLAAGGLMKQKVYEDPYGIDAWDQAVSSRCFVHLLNSEQWLFATGKQAPDTPITAQEYTKAGLPWFDHYAEGLKSLKGSEILAGLDSVAAKTIKLGAAPYPSNDPVTPSVVHVIGHNHGAVSDGKW